MKTVVIIFVVVLFVITLICYFTKCKNNDCGTPDDSTDKRAKSIRRAKQNLHPVINSNVERDKTTGRYVKKSV
jgi:hypothetical protein|tara:strand:+ start:671 stop:889 length:219 start_codon:yes stop_codon:yes gene_type:complete